MFLKSKEPIFGHSTNSFHKNCPFFETCFLTGSEMPQNHDSQFQYQKNATLLAGSRMQQHNVLYHPDGIIH